MKRCAGGKPTQAGRRAYNGEDQVQTETMAGARPFSAIVHATDFSPASERAFHHALALALVYRAHLTLAHVGPAPDQGRHFPAVRDTLQRWGLLAPGSGRAAVLDLLGLALKKVAVQGDAALTAASDYLAKQDADLLVLATAARRGPLRWLHPSLAEALARATSGPTLFVPAGARGFVDGASGALSLTRLLVPVAATPTAQRAVDLAHACAALAADEAVTITLCHIGSRDPRPSLCLAPGPAWQWLELEARATVDTRLLAAARDTQAQLIVMATAGRDSLGDLLHGTLTERVLRGAPCPLLAVPTP